MGVSRACQLTPRSRTLRVCVCVSECVRVVCVCVCGEARFDSERERVAHVSLLIDTVATPFLTHLRLVPS